MARARATSRTLRRERNGRRGLRGGKNSPIHPTIKSYIQLYTQLCNMNVEKPLWSSLVLANSFPHYFSLILCGPPQTLSIMAPLLFFLSISLFLFLPLYFWLVSSRPYYPRALRHPANSYHFGLPLGALLVLFPTPSLITFGSPPSLCQSERDPLLFILPLFCFFPPVRRLSACHAEI